MIAMGNIIAHRLHEVIEKGELGIDYTFDSQRDKNKRLRRKYSLNDNEMIKILLEIDASHYIKSENSTSVDHPNDLVHIFEITKKLIPRFETEVDYVNVCIYIKVTWPDGEEPMFIISFHEDE